MRLLCYNCEMFRSNPIVFLSRLLWQYSEGNRRMLVLYAVFSALSMVIWTFQPWLIGELLNTIQKASGVHADNMHYVLLLVCGLLLLDAVAWMFHGPSRIWEQENAHYALQKYRGHLIRGTFALPILWHGERDSGKVLDKIQKACEGLFGYGKDTFQVIHFLVRMVVTTCILAYYHVLIALVTVCLIVLSFWITYLFDIRLNRMFGELQKKENTLVARITDSLTNIFTVKILHIEKPLYKGVMEASYADKDIFFSFIRYQERKWFVGAMIFGVISLVPLFVYLYISQTTGTFALGTFTSLYLYSSNLIYVYYAFNGNYESYMRWKSRVEGVADIEDAIRTNEKHPRHVVGDWDTLTLRNVSFGYSDDALHLEGVNLTVYRGQRIALIGASGSGKTTFLKVVHGMYGNASGEYAVNDGAFRATTFADIDLESTLVPQEPEVFSSTIRENITLGADVDEESLTHALNMARFESVLPTLPNGLASVVNEKGVNLSGGQKQRLALARALLFSQQKTLLLLDESTSSVDPENEAHIYRDIFSWWGEYTVIATIHKLNLLKYFDRIIMFDKGRIVDDGSFDDLLARNPTFRIQWAEYVKSHQGE